MAPTTPSENLDLEQNLAAESVSTEAIAQESTSASVGEANAEANDGTNGQQPEASASLKGWWQVFASTYVTIFLAEIGDKTQVTTLLMSAESHKPWMVFAGAGTALVCTSLLGVLLGRWLATRLTPRRLEVSAGITLLIITAGLGWDILQTL